MARSKTSSFWLTESVTIGAGSITNTGTIDLGAYVDVGDQQALSVESVDVIWQSQDTVTGTYSSYFEGSITADAAFDMQLSDLNPGGVIVRADDSNLVASAAMNVDDANNVLSFGPDLYPDNFGKLDESRFVVNDQLYVVATSTNAIAPNRALVCTVRIKARIVKLGTKDWMAIAISSVASDN